MKLTNFLINIIVAVPVTAIISGFYFLYAPDMEYKWVYSSLVFLTSVLCSTLYDWINKSLRK